MAENLTPLQISQLNNFLKKRPEINRQAAINLLFNPKPQGSKSAMGTSVEHSASSKPKTTDTKSSDGNTDNLSKTLKKRIELTGKQLARDEKDNSFIGKAWSWVKNNVSVWPITKTDSSDKVRTQLDKEKKLLAKYNNPTIKEEEKDKIFEQLTGKKATDENKNKFIHGKISLKSENMRKAYKEGQDMAVDTVSDLVSGVVSMGVYTAAVAAAPFTGGASIAVGAVAAGAAGGAVKSVIKHADAAARGKKYTYNMSDMGFGALNGVLAPITGGAGGAIAKGFAVRAGLEVVKDMGKAGVKTATKQGVKYTVKNGVKNKVINAMMNPTGYTYKGGSMIKRASAYAIEAAADGAISGAVDGGVRTGVEGGSVTDIAKGAGMGFLMGGTMGAGMGAGMKVNGIIGHKAGVKAEPRVKISADKLKRRFTKTKKEVAQDTVQTSASKNTPEVAQTPKPQGAKGDVAQDVTPTKTPKAGESPELNGKVADSAAPKADSPKHTAPTAKPAEATPTPQSAKGEVLGSPSPKEKIYGTPEDEIFDDDVVVVLAEPKIVVPKTENEVPLYKPMTKEEFNVAVENYQSAIGKLSDVQKDILKNLHEENPEFIDHLMRQKI